MLTPTSGHKILFMCFRSQTAPESERCFVKSRFSVALLNSLADFATEIHFGHEKPSTLMHLSASYANKYQLENLLCIK